MNMASDSQQPSIQWISRVRMRTGTGSRLGSPATTTGRDPVEGRVRTRRPHGRTICLDEALVLMVLALSACADTEPPVLVDVTLLDDTTDTVGPYTVTAVARDDRGLDSVKLYYTSQVGENAAFKDVEMTQVQDDLYSGEIAGFPAGATVRYFVEAKDASANYTRVPPQGELFRFDVVEGP